MYPFSKIEKKWQKKWQSSGIYEPNLKTAKKPFYNLMMFPYPSAEGLHVGNMYAVTGSDIYGRMKRMQGYDVFEPIGLDGFGINSENYAIKIGKHPADQAKISEKNFYRQLQMVGSGFAWNERLETYDPEYYKWTQWLFVQMFKAGLAYRKKQAVNWCPSCKTVLADEQVIAGECERCSSQVIKRQLEQWFFKITDYAGKLEANLDKIDWSEKVKVAQRNWIGKSEGALVKFPIADSEQSIEVFTTRPDTMFGATYVVLAPEHPLVEELKLKVVNLPEVNRYIKNAKDKSEAERIDEGKEKSGVELKGVLAINPANRKSVPIWIADYVLSSYGTGAIMAVPAHDERDLEFAKKFNLPVVPVITNKLNEEFNATGLYVGLGTLQNSGKFDGMNSEKAKWEITKFVDGKKKVNYHLRDWLISRQRYWGPPIPMIHCDKCEEAGRGERKDMPGWYTVPEKDLPVKLPYVKDFRPTGTDKSPLASIEQFYKTRCPKCRAFARRETDVSDTFLDSAWYYLRYPSVKNKKAAWDKAIIKKWFPVNLYTGGAEHSVLHLLYVRFVAMALKDMGLVDFEEPFPKFRAHGLIIKDGAKMSKSKGNVINPDIYIKDFGADALRMYLMFMGPFDSGGDFRDSGIQGTTRFLERVWKLSGSVRFANKGGEDIDRHLHRTIKKVTDDIEVLAYNTAISALMIQLNQFEESRGFVSEGQFAAFVQLIAPFAPHIAEEIWSKLYGARIKSIHVTAWPKYDPKLLVDSSVTLVIQVNGKVRSTVSVNRGISEEEAVKIALADPKVKQILSGQYTKRVIFVKDRLVNFVI
jgi:leucyl-tRNA synthetase